MIKRLLLVFLVFLTFSITGCTPEPQKPFDIALVYTDVPGITPEEINSIERLKADGKRYVYGVLLSTEAYPGRDGHIEGYAAALSGLLEKMFGISIELKHFEWDELIDKLTAGEIAFTGELTATEERMHIFSMSQPIADRTLLLFKNEQSVKLRSEEDIKGLSIGFLTDSNTPESIFRKAYPLTFNVISVNNYQTAAQMLINGDIDAFIDEATADIAFEPYGKTIRSIPIFPMVHEPVSLTTALPELKPVISVLDKYIANGGMSVLYDLYKNSEFGYAKHKLNNALNAEERAYLSQLITDGGKLPIAIEHDNYPVSFYNDKEHAFQGIAVDVLTEIGHLTGITFVPANTKDATWTEIFRDLSSGATPMATQLLYSEERTELFLWSSVPYASSYYALMSRMDYPKIPAYRVKWERVGVIADSGELDIFRKLFPDNENLILYQTQNESLDALERGDVDLLMASDYSLLAQTNYREKPCFKVNIVLNLPMNSQFGFHKSQSVLRSIIEKAQRQVQTNLIEQDWTSRHFDYTKKYNEERAGFMTFFLIVISAVLAITVFILFKNIRLGNVLKQIASHDALTAIYNRRYFLEQAAVQISRSIRLNNECFIVIFDLDYFKVINDTHGHSAGDAVLRETADRVKKAIRPYDLFGRYGGEEFILLMCDTDHKNVINAIERIRQDVFAEPILYEGKKLILTASFGIAPAAPVNDLSAAIEIADEALYRAKEAGRNRVVFDGETGNERTYLTDHSDTVTD